MFKYSATGSLYVLISHADSCPQTLTRMHMGLLTHTHTHMTLFKEVCFFYYFLSHSTASPLFQSALGVQWKSRAYYVLWALQTQRCFVQIAGTLSLLLYLSLIFTVRVLALRRRLFSQFSPLLTAKCGPCECKHAVGRDIFWQTSPRMCHPAPCHSFATWHWS